MIGKMFWTAALVLIAVAGRCEASDLRLWRLDGGAIEVNDLDLFSDTAAYAGRRKTLTDSCYLIRHGQEYMLWDAGLPGALLGADPGKGPFAPSLKQTIASQIEALGIAPGRISRLGLSHGHFDHAGQAADFPQARLLIGKADFEALRADPPPFGFEPGLLAPWSKGDAPVEPVVGDKDVFGDGSVVMLAMPGHTPGSYALLVRLEKAGPVLLSGDVACFEEQLAEDQTPSFNADRAQSLASMARLKEMARRLKATLVIQHDPDHIPRLPPFPAFAQ